jgi:hypothetical protein
MVNLTTKQVEILIEVLGNVSSKLKALGIVDIDGAMTYTADSENIGYVYAI